MSLFGAADKNTAARKAEKRDYERAKEQWRLNEDQRRDTYTFSKEQYEAQVQNREDQLRFQEENILNDHDYVVRRQNYEFDLSQRAFDRSVEQAESQKRFNAMAEINAYADQDAKRRDDLLAAMFDESDSVLQYISNTSGINLARGKGITDASFQRAKVDSKFAGDISDLQIQKRQTQAKSALESQQLIVDGMKLAGQMRAKAGSGRSAAKAVLGALAESGARRAAIANALMYAESGVELGMAQLKDMLILDQTMSLAAKHYAENDFDLKAGRFDAERGLDQLKLEATKRSTAQRDRVVIQNIQLQRENADLAAESSILMQPERLPAPVDPRERWAKYDDPETEDYVEILMRPDLPEYPEFRPSEEPDMDDYRGTRGRVDVGMSNFGDVLKIGGAVATGIGTLGAAGVGGIFTMKPATASVYSTVGSSLGNLSQSFYPKGY